MSQQADKPKIEVHSRVILHKGEFNPGRTNPAWGGEYACEGTVRSIRGGYDKLPIFVLWDNGFGNSYNHHHLLQVEDSKNNPNLSFRLKKAREEKKRK